jgi:hypothetical protein
MLIERTCEYCEVHFEATRANARYCGPAHRNAAYRQRRSARLSAGSEADPSVTSEGSQDVKGIGVRRALLAELRGAQAEGTAMGQVMLAIAHEIDKGATGAELATLALRLGVELPRTIDRAATAAARNGVEDEVGRARRERDRKRGVAR